LRCSPKPGCNKTIVWEIKFGYRNPVNHLETCYGTENLLELFTAAKMKAESSQGQVREYFNYAAASPIDHAVYNWIKLIVMKSLPLGIVEDPLYRQFSSSSVHVSTNTIKETIFALVELVEQKIALELHQARCGAIMHDAWIKMSVH
jgi:hypothetical protein